MAKIFPQHATTLTHAFSELTEEELITLQHACRKLSNQIAEV